MSRHTLIGALSTTGALAGIFDDASVLQAMLDFEVALSRVEARAGIIPASAAEAVARAAQAGAFDAGAIAEEARRSATVAIPFVAALVERVRAIDADAAAYVHWGATSQDVADTALVLLLTRARPLLAGDADRLASALHRLSEAHASTVMLGRTLMQPATPITFGLKAAHWYATVKQGAQGVGRALDECESVQFGGAAGTLAVLGDKGPEIGRALADELGLRPSAPWHTDRQRLASVVTACGLCTAALGKIARDVTLLSQREVGEVAPGGGGSSTMPHKQNPSGCAIASAAATRLPGIVAAFLSGTVQEHERAAGGWQAEWPLVSDAVESTAAALAAIAGVIEQLQVVPDRMRANLEATGGAIFAERATFLLRPKVGRERAETIVAAALEASRGGNPSFAAALGASKDAVQALGRDQIRRIDRPEDYLGAAEAFRRELLA